MSGPPTRSSARPRRARHAAVALATALVAGGLTAAVSAPAGAAGRPAPPPAAAGALDAVTGGSGQVRVQGWALDPTSPAGLGVFVSIDSTWHLVAASQLRADVWRAFPRSGPFHGFDATLPAGPGTHFVCAVAAGGRTTPTVLGCRLVDAGRSPVGSYDSATVTAAERVRVVGWAADPDTTAPLGYRVTVDGAVRATGTASTDRPDVGAAFPAFGRARGVDATVAVPVGTHLVCLDVFDGGSTWPVSLGCRAVAMPQTQPRGNVEQVWVEGNSVVAVGWADDPDGPASPAVAVGVSFGGVGDPASATGVADLPRPDVAAFLGVPAARGFRIQVPIDRAGPSAVCVSARNQNLGSDQVIGCRPLGVSDRRPQGWLERVDPVASGVSVQGWFADPDSAAPVSVRISVDGVVHQAVADRSRLDVAAVFPSYGADRGLSATIGGLAPGIHDVCVTALDLGGMTAGITGDTTPPCSTVVVGPVAVGTVGEPAAPTQVGPRASSPISGIDRDGGVAVPLRDGSTLWLFADSMAKRADGSLRFFVRNTAAWAGPGSATVTEDATSDGGPVLFATPGPSFPACSDPSFSKALWPMSAVAVPSGAVDRVVVYLANMCVKDGDEPVYEPHGVSVAEWVYDPSAPHAGRPIQATLLAQHLFSDVDTTEAAVLAPDGYLYVYGCDGPDNGGWPTQYGPCTVGRVLPADVATASAYRWWNGSSWGSGAASPMSMPDGRDGVTNLPVGAVDVVRDPSSGAYVMGYSPWPGFTNQLALRVATSPEGPWTPPVVVHLPGCDDVVGGTGLHCYAAAVQPRFSRAGVLGVGWYDQAVAAGPTRGSYVVSTLQFTIDADG